MAATKVGVREFRKGLADYIDGDAPVMVTRHGQTVGFFIPSKPDLAAEVAAFKQAKEKLDSLIDISEDELDELVASLPKAKRAK